MASASVPGAGKPITILVAVLDRLNVWHCPADSMMARIGTIQPKAEYTTAADSTCLTTNGARNYLREESIHEGLGVGVARTSSRGAMAWR